MQGTLVLIIAAFILYFFIVVRPTGLLTANALFVYIQMVMAIGIYRMLDPNLAADIWHEYLLMWCLTSYMAVSALIVLHNPVVSRVGSNRTIARPPVHILKPNLAVTVLILISISMVVAYFSAIGYSAFIRGLMNSLSGGTADIAGQRLAGYSGSRYLFPGYVNQFKNALLPALTLLVITHWIKSKVAHPFLTIMLVGITIFGLVGTGQRGAFVQFALTTALFLYLMNGNRFPPGTLKLAAAAATVLIASTIALGRSNSELAADAPLISRTAAAAREVGGRVFEDQQIAAVAGFRFIFNQPIQEGAEWLQAFLGVLPGKGGSALSSHIHLVLYGSGRGTAPPSIWGSVYHNFGWVGIAVVPAMLAVIFVTVSRHGTVPKPRNTLELIGISGTFATIGLWASGSPDYLLNSGLVVYVALWLWGASSKRLGDAPQSGIFHPAQQNGQRHLAYSPPMAKQNHVN